MITMMVVTATRVVMTMTGAIVVMMMLFMMATVGIIIITKSHKKTAKRREACEFNACFMRGPQPHPDSTTFALNCQSKRKASHMSRGPRVLARRLNALCALGGDAQCAWVWRGGHMRWHPATA